MVVDAYLTPYFPETENQFDGSIVVMIDVLRASTSLTAALYNGAKEVIPVDTLDKAVRIYTSLSKEVRFLSGERNGIKPNGFDAGNSPLEYSEQAIKGKTIVLTTTNGSKTFQKAKLAKQRIIGSFVNFTAVKEYLQTLINEIEINNLQPKVYFLCAGTNGKLCYEDMLCAGAFIYDLFIRRDHIIISDAAETAKNLFMLHRNNLANFLKTREHAIKLKELGFGADLDISFTYDKYPVVPIIQGSSIKTYEINNHSN
jgi:2-phosphosulfolactate phosphatase